MSFLTMWSEVTGSVPKIPSDYAQTIVNRAWQDVRRQNLWSFLIFEGNWTSPSIVNAGTVSVTQGATTVTFNSTARTAINAIGSQPSPVTSRQFRIGVGTVYSLWGWNPITGVATLDKPYQEASGSAASYVISQWYYPAPVQDWWGWFSIRDTVNFNELCYTKTRAWVDQRDPQRLVAWIPSHVVYYTQDQNVNSPTYTWPTFELWASPTYQLTYQLYGIRKGLPLVNPTDTLPPAVGEDAVLALAKRYAYEWAEANRGDVPRANGTDFRFLIGAADAEYKRLFREYRKQDRELVDSWHSTRKTTWNWPSILGQFNSISGYASPGAPW